MLRFVSATIPASLIVVALSGCKTTGQQSTANQLESLRQFRTSLDTASKQISATTGALDQLAATTTGDLRPAYQKFTTELTKLDSDTATAKSRAAAMRERAREHLELWEKETQPPASLSNPELQKISESQRALAKERFEALRAAAETGRDAYSKLSLNLHDIKKVLDLNLTQGGVAALKPVIETTKQDAQVAQDSIGQIVTKLESVKTALSPGSGAPVPASGPAAPPSNP